MKKLLFIFFCLFASVEFIYSQNITVTGTVVDQTGLEVVGASVIQKGTTNGIATDIDGKFSLTVPENSTLVISLVGMKKTEAKAQPNMKVVLEDDSALLDEVVVVAYGTQSARTIASAISTVRADKIKDVPQTSADQMLQGRASGVQITTPSGGVGSAPKVRIRGVNSITSGTEPLYIVDGLAIESDKITQLGSANPLASINPADILSMEVLKDASAASLYGSRAANGVILITTKKGSKGRAKVTYDMYVGFSNKTGFYDMLNAEEYVNFKNTSYVNRYGTSSAQYFIDNKYSGYQKSSYGPNVFNLMTRTDGSIVDTDWSDSVFRTGFTQNHNIGVSGGGENFQYYVSSNYLHENGIVKGDELERLGLKANVSVDATKWLKLGISVNQTSSTTKNVDAARNGSTFASGGFPRMALINAPNIPEYNEDGTPYGGKTGLGYGPNAITNSYYNPTKLIAIGNGYEVVVNRTISQFFADVKPISGLVLRTQFGLDYTKVGEERFWSPLQGDGVNSNGMANRYDRTIKRWTWTNTANYDLALGDNHFNFLVGTEANARNYEHWTAQRQDLLDDKFVGFNSPFNTATSSGDSMKNTLASFFGRVNYDYAYKYILSLNFRRDGFSALGPNDRWGNFGGASVAYRLSEEKYFEPLKEQIQDFKIKASFGTVGNTSKIKDYASWTYYKNDQPYGTNSAYYLYRIGDSNLKWETSHKYDVGFITRFLNRFTLDFDYYLTKSSDLILNVPQAPSKGIPGNIITSNMGKMQNNGVEVNLSVDIFNTPDFKWTSSFNFTSNQNKIKALAPGVPNLIGQDNNGLEITNLSVVGKSIGQLYTYPTAGIDEKTGRRVFIGTQGERLLVSYNVNPITGVPESGVFWNEDGTKMRDDQNIEQVLSGGTLPTWFGGWDNTFEYKGFDLNVFFQYSGGNYIYNGTQATVSDYRFWNNTNEVLTKTWSKENPSNAKFPIPVYGDNVSNGSAYPISDWIEKGDYLRLKNISLGYTFNMKNIESKIGLSRLRVYAQAQNLFVITGYSGMDPEVLSNTESPALAGGVDKNTLPQARTFTFGLNATF